MNNKAILYSSYEEEKQQHFHKKQTTYYNARDERIKRERER
jgi:hypothetical protein|tara:strand:- start:247 stop:369 length:123 start_codon:yes stop_codon:yes gene_type:complete